MLSVFQKNIFLNITIFRTLRELKKAKRGMS